MRWMLLRKAFAFALVLTVPGMALGLEIYSTSFEKGGDNPDGWRIESGKGEWSKQGRNGGRCLALFGQGEGSCTWRGDAIPFKPNQLYRATFYTRRDSKKTKGSLLIGASFCRRDFYGEDEWEKKTLIFRAPVNVPPDAHLFFSQYCINGIGYMDDMRLEEVSPRYLTENGITLSADEKIRKGEYLFESHFENDFANHCRVEVEHTAEFHSNRHWFKKDLYVLHRYAVPGFAQLSATLKFRMSWYTDGETVVEASKDGKGWRELGRFSPVGEYTVELPKDLFPAPALSVRFTGTGNFQINKYIYSAKLDGAPPDMEGRTEVFSGHYVSADSGKLRLEWSEDRPALASVRFGDKLIGDLSCIIAQFEKAGVGYKGTGVGSANATRVKSVALKKKDPAEAVAEVTAERSDSEETRRRFEAVYQFTLRAGQSWFESRLLSVKNTDAVPYKMIGYYHSLGPSEGADVRPVGYGACAAWVGKESFIAALALRPEDFTLGFRKAGQVASGDITRKVEAQLAPGQTWSAEEPATVVYAGEGNEKAVVGEAGRIQSLLLRPPSEYASGVIRYEEEKAQ